MRREKILVWLKQEKAEGVCVLYDMRCENDDDEASNGARQDFP